MDKTIDDRQNDLDESGKNLTKHIPCAVPTFEKVDEQYCFDRLMDIHREAMNPYSIVHPTRLSVAGKQIENIMKAKGYFSKKEVDKLTEINSKIESLISKTVGNVLRPKDDQ